jgi:hypothetical protein
MKYVRTFEQFINDKYSELNESVNLGATFNPKKLGELVELTKVPVEKFLNKHGYSIFYASSSGSGPFNVGVTTYKGSDIQLFYENKKGEMVRVGYSFFSNTVGFDIYRITKADESGEYKVLDSLLPLNERGRTGVAIWPARKSTYEEIVQKIYDSLS